MATTEGTPAKGGLSGFGLETPPDLRRVAVIGCSCVGKTTFARRLAEALGSRFIELDAVHWLPDWVERDDGEFREIMAQAVKEEHWIIDGNYRQAQDITWGRATAVVWLNYSFPLVCYRALTRTIGRGLTGRTLWSGNKESLRKAFWSKDSILLWVLQTYHSRRRRYRAVFDTKEMHHLQYIEFRRSRDADQFLRGLDAGPAKSRRYPRPDS